MPRIEDYYNDGHGNVEIIMDQNTAKVVKKAIEAYTNRISTSVSDEILKEKLIGEYIAKQFLEDDYLAQKNYIRFLRDVKAKIKELENEEATN